MAQFIVRNIEEDVKRRLRRRAARHGFSMEEEVRQILRNAANYENDSAVRLGSRIAARFSKIGLSKGLTELRGQVVRPLHIGK